MKLDNSQIRCINNAALQAGGLIMQYRHTWLAEGFDVDVKGDNSPVTQADKAADAYICKVLRDLTPDIPIISEEGTQHQYAAQDGLFWCVDPLDGTKTFVRGGKNFTVNIALVHNFMPVFGVIYAPAHGQLYYGSVSDDHAYKSEHGKEISITTRTASLSGLTAYVSKNHGSAMSAQLHADYNITESIPASSSIKFCRLAEGLGDIYPRFGPTMEWDTAAGHAILLAAGGRIDVMTDHAPLCYSKRGFLNPNFVAYGCK
jgi:3'(2'), 5'-bisphosphate nucleotidase